MPDTRDPQAVIAAAEQAALAGDYAAAEGLLREAAGLQEASLGPNHPELANTLNNLGVVYEVTEKPDEAERCFRRASAIAAAVLAPDHPFVATSRKNLEDFCAARGIPVDAPAPAGPVEPPAIERPAIESTPAAIAQPPLVAAPPVVAPPPLVAPLPIAAPPPILEKKARDTPAVPERAPTRSLAVAGLVAAALIVAFLLGSLWFGSSEVPPPASEPVASAPAPGPVVAAPPPSPATAPPVSDRKEVPPAKRQPPAKPARPADTGAPQGAPIVVSIQVCADLRTSGAGEWRCTPPRNPATPGRLYFYTRIKSERQTKVQHRWYQGERLRQNVDLTVHTNPGAGYRTYSRNTVSAGEWRVELRTRDGALLREVRFTVK